MCLGRLSFRPSESVQRRSRQSRLAAAFAWLTAVLLLVQPGAAVHCQCRLKIEECSSACHEHCHDHCCGHDHGNQLRTVCAIAKNASAKRLGGSLALPSLSLPSPLGCPCPENCPCRVQHAQQQLGMIRSAGSERVLKNLLLSSAVVITPREFPLVTESKPVSVAPRSAQLQSCAMLCRFTI